MNSDNNFSKDFIPNFTPIETTEDKKKSERPLGVTILAFLQIIGAILLLIILIVSPKVFFHGYKLPDAIYFLSTGLGGALVVISLVIAAGLLKGYKWARTTTIILEGIAIATSFINLNILSAVIAVYIIYYLTKSHVKTYFGISEIRKTPFDKTKRKRLLVLAIVIIIVSMCIVFWLQVGKLDSDLDRFFEQAQETFKGRELDAEVSVDKTCLYNIYYTIQNPHTYWINGGELHIEGYDKVGSKIVNETRYFDSIISPDGGYTNSWTSFNASGDVMSWELSAIGISETGNFSLDTEVRRVRISLREYNISYEIRNPYDFPIDIISGNIKGYNKTNDTVVDQDIANLPEKIEVNETFVDSTVFSDAYTDIECWEIQVIGHKWISVE